MKWDIKFSDPDWRRWFAWYPVRIDDEIHWLVFVERWREWPLGYTIHHYRSAR